MNVKVSHLLAILATVFLFAFSAQAQEEPQVEIPDPSHHEFSFEDDKTLIYDHNVHSTRGDSLQVLKVTPSVKAAKPDAHKKDEEDALSFNFIYYFIQKFKMSDLVDQ